jgi:DNA-binding MarR family transcriptional regulator
MALAAQMSHSATLTDSPSYLLKRTEALLHSGLTCALTQHGATIAEYAVLEALDEEPGMSNADLARRAFVTPQTMNEVLRELELKRWVTRHPHPHHGRIRQASLTPDGRAALRNCRQAATALEKQMLARLSPVHRHQLTTALRLCIEALSPAAC